MSIRDQELPEEVRDAVACLVGFLIDRNGSLLRVPVRCDHGHVQFCVVVAADNEARTLDSFAEFQEQAQEESI